MEGNTEIDETYGINVQFEESSEEDDEDAYGEVILITILLKSFTLNHNSHYTKKEGFSIASI